MINTPQPRSIEAAAGHVLFRPEETCPGFLTVKKGVIKVFLTGPNGREIVLYRVRPGDVCLQTFSCLADGLSYSAEGVAETDLEAELISREAYEKLLANDQPFRDQVMAAIARRFADFEHLIESVALTSLDARLAEALLRLAADGNQIDTTHEAIAAEIGSAREVVSRQLSRFTSSNLVSLSRGSITLLSKRGLEKVIDQAG